MTVWAELLSSADTEYWFINLLILWPDATVWFISQWFSGWGISGAVQYFTEKILDK